LSLTGELTILTALAVELQQRRTLEELLQLLVQRCAILVETPRASVRLFDGQRQRLFAKVRAGDPLHVNPTLEFAKGQGLVGWVAEQGKSLRTGDAEHDPRFVSRPDMREPMASFLGVPLLAQQNCIGVLCATSQRRDHFSTHHEQLLTLLAALCAPYVEMARLARLAHMDPLTGVHNRNGLDVLVPESGGGTSLSLALCDLDRFKSVNDEHGHLAGDDVLRVVAMLLSSATRAGDAVVRYGGEEFLMVLPGADLASAAIVAERARELLESRTITAGAATVRVTGSFGVAERRSGEQRLSVLARADEALYRAKQGGRNRIALAR
jgi:diguanylate cyclase (GGDEF)-like protein